jgi:exodeoxyribonuclease VII large subunit
MKGESRDKAFSVTEITNHVKEILEKNINSAWIQGEISNYSSPASGHIYFTLKDENNQIKVAFFGGKRKAGNMDLEDGKKVAVFGRLSIYGKRSEYQLIAEEIQVTGVGDLLVEFEKLKKKLSSEGLFDQGHKVNIPEFPEKIGIITSPTGAAIRDIVNIITRRYPSVQVLIYPALVQGADAAPQVIKALQDMDSMGMDVIILARGGGSIEDLWAFNDERLAYAIYETVTPVVSAIGHEIDFTIADFVSDLRAPTPSAAAELVVPDRAELSETLDSMKSKIRTSIAHMVDMYQERLDNLSKSYAFKLPFQMYTDYAQRVDEIAEGFAGFLDEKLDESSDKVKVIADKLKILNPLNILNKGYSVVYDGETGKILKDSSEAGKTIRVKMHKGILDADVKKRN